MIMSVIVLIIWLFLGVWGIIWDTLTSEFNFIFMLYLVAIPFLPFIWHWCGLF